MVYIISKLDKRIKGNVYLSASKSESNRVLIIQALCKQPFRITNLADSQDTQILNEILKNEISKENTSSLKKLNVEVSYYTGPGGTTIRFLAAFFAMREGTRILYGTERMNERPIKPLVDALIKLGANITYLGKEGCAPIKIIGKKLKGGDIEIDSDVSSQFITALLLIAPCIEGGLNIHLQSNAVSRSYIMMTLKILEHFGAKHSWIGNVISIPEQKYQGWDYNIEADWSSASYWYALAALADEANIKIHGLHKKSLQGDAVAANLFKFFGVDTTFLPDGVQLVKGDYCAESLAMDFSDCPDIVQTTAVVAAVKKLYCSFTGLQTLRIKETDRIHALKEELKKIGVRIEERENDSIEIMPDRNAIDESILPEFQTYHDHRMALAFAPLALVYPEIKIHDPEVVKKSYPDYWKEMKNMGFDITIEH